MRRQVDHDEVNVDIFNDDALDEELATRADEVVAATAMRSNASSDVGSRVAVGESSDGTRRARTCSYTKYKKVERSLCVYIRGSETVLGAGLRQQDVVEAIEAMTEGEGVDHIVEVEFGGNRRVSLSREES